MPPTRRPQDVWKVGPPDGAGRPAHPRTARPGRRWLTAALIVAALGGIAVGLFVYIRPDPPPTLLAIPVTQYAHPDWPPNPWAEADARGFRDRFGGDSAQAFQVQEKDRILRELTQAADRARGGRRPVVVYLSALGVAADGKPYLLPGGALPDDPGTWLPLDEVLRPLRGTDAPRLLILDVRPVASPRAVLPTEDVNEVLDAALAKLDAASDLHFRVLTANTPCGGANVVRPLNRTAFGLALGQAAGGSADGWNRDRAKDGRVSVEELLAYVREVTYALSVAYGHPAQLPRAHGKGPDFFLLDVPGDGPAALPTLPDGPDPYPGWLREGWTTRDEWVLKQHLHRRAPRAVHHLSLAATRAERRWLAGLDPKSLGDQFTPLAGGLRKTAEGLRPPVPLVRSVARARANRALDVKAAETALRPVFDRIGGGPGAKKEELTAAVQAARAKPPDPDPFDATAAALWGFALGLENPTHEQVQQLAVAAAAFRPTGRPPHPELLALELVAGLRPGLVARWPAGTTRRFLLTVQAAEDAAAFDGRCLPWVRGRLAKADRARWEAVRALCNPDSPAAALREAADGLDAARADYDAVRHAAVALTAALAEYEETRAALADLAVAYPHDLVPVPEAVATTWAGLVDDVQRLRALLRPPDKPDGLDLPDPAALNQASQGVRSKREWLRVRLRDFAGTADTAGPRQLEAALLWPGWPLPEREKFLARLDATGREAAGRVLRAWPAQPSGQEPASPPRCSPRVAADSLRDARRVVDLLRLADGPDAAELAAKARGLGPSPGPRDAAELAGRARAAWRVRLPAEYRTADPRRQAAVGWAVDPEDVPAAPRTGVADPANPEPDDVRKAEEAYHAWLGRDRYRAEAAVIRPLDHKAARDYADALDRLGRDFGEWTP